MPLDLARCRLLDLLNALPDVGNLIFFDALAQPVDELFVTDFAAEDDAGLETFAHDALRIGRADAGRLDHGGIAH